LPYAARVKELVDSFWHAAAYRLHPRVILMSLLPLLFAVALVFALGWFYWESAVAGVRASLEQWSMVVTFLQWLDSLGAAAFHTVLAPLIAVALAVPVIVVASLLLVAWLMTPALVGLVAVRRFDALERKRGASRFTLVFASSSLWFAHFGLAALQRLRMQSAAAAEAAPLHRPAAAPPPRLETSALAALPPA
jgi:hypothetical protein